MGFETQWKMGDPECKRPPQVGNSSPNVRYMTDCYTEENANPHQKHEVRGEKDGYGIGGDGVLREVWSSVLAGRFVRANLRTAQYTCRDTSSGKEKQLSSTSRIFLILTGIFQEDG